MQLGQQLVQQNHLAAGLPQVGAVGEGRARLRAIKQVGVVAHLGMASHTQGGGGGGGEEEGEQEVEEEEREEGGGG